jgi:hypothetical protein
MNPGESSSSPFSKFELLVVHLSGIFAAVVLSSSGRAAVHYVDLNSTNPTPPYTHWVTAATVIQDAVDAASSGDTVLVTNGVYSTGRPSSPNRVGLSSGVILQSINGPAVTFIRGNQVSNSFVRCVYLGNNSFLSGFTLTNGSAGFSEDAYGGGAYCNWGSVISPHEPTSVRLGLGRAQTLVFSQVSTLYQVQGFNARKFGRSLTVSSAATTLAVLAVALWLEL